MLKNLSADKQEIGIDIVREFRGKGVGYAAVNLLINHAKEVSGANCFQVKVYSDNTASRKLFEKLGAVKMGEEDSEFIYAMKMLEKEVGIEEMNQLKEKHSELFRKSNEKNILVYDLEA